MQALTPRERPKNLSLTVEWTEVPIPDAMVPAEAAKLISEGHAIDVLPADEEVSTQEAADLLKVSRPYLLNLVKKGILPCRWSAPTIGFRRVHSSLTNVTRPRGAGRLKL